MIAAGGSRQDEADPGDSLFHSFYGSHLSGSSKPEIRVVGGYGARLPHTVDIIVVDVAETLSIVALQWEYRRKQKNGLGS